MGLDLAVQVGLGVWSALFADVHVCMSSISITCEKKFPNDADYVLVVSPGTIGCVCGQANSI